MPRVSIIRESLVRKIRMRRQIGIVASTGFTALPGFICSMRERRTINFRFHVFAFCLPDTRIRMHSSNSASAILSSFFFLSDGCAVFVAAAISRGRIGSFANRSVRGARFVIAAKASRRCKREDSPRYLPIAIRCEMALPAEHGGSGKRSATRSS